MAIPTYAVTPFQGISGQSIAIQAGAASAAVRVLPDMNPNANPALRQLRIANLSTTDTAYLAWGTDNSVAVAIPVAGGAVGGMAIPANDVEVITIGAAAWLATITSGAAVVLNVTPGGGV